MRRFLAILTMFASGAAAAYAQELPTQSWISTPDGPRPLSMTEAPYWNAVGRLDTGVSFCSGTLIAPDLVLTAAHCLYHPRTDERFAPTDFTFSAGLRNGQPQAIRRVRSAVALEGYRPDIGEDLEMIGRDLAVLQLQHPIGGTNVVPMATGDAGRARDPMVIVSYGEDREAHASIEEGCEVLGSAGSVRSLSCQVVSGSSGSPVLRVVNGRPEIVAVVSASAEVGGEAVSLVVVLDEHLNELMSREHTNGVMTSTTSGALFLGVGNDGRDDIGARFIRP